MDNLSKTKKKVFAWMAIVALAIVAWFLIFYFANKEARETGIVYKELLDFQKEKDQLLLLERSVESNKQKTDDINSYFVTEKSVLPFIESLESSARASGVLLEVKNIKLVGGDAKDKVDNTTFSLRVVGSYSGSIKFFGLLENLPFLSTIESVVMQSTTNEEGGSSWISNVEVSLASVLKQNEN